MTAQAIGKYEMNEISALASRVWSSWLDRDPGAGTDRPGNLTTLASGSLAESEETAFAGRHFLRELAGLPTDRRSHDEDLTADFLEWMLGTWVDAPSRFWFDIPIAPYSAHRRFDANTGALRDYVFASDSDVDGYLELIQSFTSYVAQTTRTLETQAKRGIVLSREALPSTLAALDAARSTALALVPPGMERLVALSPGGRSRLLDRGERIIQESLEPAYDDLLEFAHGLYSEQAPDGVGFSQYPGGEGFYRSIAAFWTTSERSVEELHELGIEQVEMLTDRMSEVRGQVGYRGSEREFHDELSRDSRFFANTPEQVAERYLGHMNRISASLPDLFHSQPAAPYGVRQLDASLEESMTYGFYEVPTRERPQGTYVFNGADLGQRSLIVAASLILHELSPGHHLQIATQLENLRLPEVRRQPVLATTAFIEGWAEYAAGLGWEIGAYEDPYDAYGRLSFERFFAQRLVVDTGMNALGWSLNRGRAYMLENTMESPLQVASETIRYATDTPGQALAYRPGHLELDELRRVAADRIGSGFDVRDFHDVVLSAGALPFPALARHVEWWIEQTRSGSVTNE